MNYDSKEVHICASLADAATLKGEQVKAEPGLFVDKTSTEVPVMSVSQGTHIPVTSRGITGSEEEHPISFKFSHDTARGNSAAEVSAKELPPLLPTSIANLLKIKKDSQLSEAHSEDPDVEWGVDPLPAEIKTDDMRQKELKLFGIKVLSVSTTSRGSGIGLEVEVTGPDGVATPIIISRRDMAQKPSKVYGILADHGAKLPTDKKARELLLANLMNVQPERIITVTNQVGWAGNGRYVLPGETLGWTGPSEPDGNAIRNYRYITSPAGTPDFSVSGDLETWQRDVASLCQGNPYLAFSVSSAFAAVLLKPLGLQGGGFNFCGPSSTGKTSALIVGSSVFGSPEKRIQTWKATVNGLEALAYANNDALLCLDEYGELGAKEAGSAAYMLANGEGKKRLNPDASSQQPRTWKSLFLSSGEVGLVSLSREAGQVARAGQQVRVIDIPVDANGGKGIIDTLHGRVSSGELVKELRKNASKNHGIAIREFLHRIGAVSPDLIFTKLREDMASFSAKYSHPQKTSGQVERVLERFAVVAAAGSMATRLGITKWDKGEAVRAAAALFEKWLEENSDHGTKEECAILYNFMRHMQEYGETRYSELLPKEHITSKRRKSGKNGFFERIGERTTYYIFPEAFRDDICGKYEPRMVKRVLSEKGILIQDKEGEGTFTKRFGEFGVKRVYELRLPQEDAKT